jgi:LmbE family N-acetylglucosaminyl deacetylase
MTFTETITVLQTMPRNLLIFSALLLLLALNACQREPAPRTYFPETGRFAVHQRTLDLVNDFNVLSLALQPGFEDLETLAYLRFARGATILSVYLTNGEAGESDVRSEYPHYLAAQLREEAYQALQHLGGQVGFLNMPHVWAARDSGEVRVQWPADTVQARLATIMRRFKPDLVLLAPDRRSNPQEVSWPWRCFISDAQATMQALAQIPAQETATNGHTDYWRVARVLRNDIMDGQKFQLEEEHPLWKKSYRTMGEEAAQRYVSLAVQRQYWRRDHEPAYRLFTAAFQASSDELLAGLPLPSTRLLRSMHERVEQLAGLAKEGKNDAFLRQSVAVIDSISYMVGVQKNLNPFERRRALHWKKLLDDLRCTLLGVQVKYAFGDTALTERQVTFLSFHEVKGLQKEGQTNVFFPATTKGWAVDENIENKLPLRLNDPYRLLSPQQISYTYPPALYDLTAETVHKPFLFFIMHQAPKREHSFIYRLEPRLEFAPRMIEEVKTPMVRMVAGERVAVRLMNISRDGVADTIEVSDALATSTPSFFRLSHKGAEHVDTLHLFWQGRPADGTYLIPIEIDGIPVGRFAARKFDANLVAEKRIGLITSLQNSATAETLRRLRARYRLLPVAPQRFDSLEVIIIDRRALSQRPEIAQHKQALEEFVKRGGHLLVLAQEARAWNEHPLWSDMQLVSSLRFAADCPLHFEPGHAILSRPNALTDEAWQNWLYARAYNLISGAALSRAETPISAGDGKEALVLTMKMGQGRQTYVDLALEPQFMNVHPGVFQLFANLVSY